MASSREEQVAAAREFDRISTVLVDLGVKTVKKNPIKVTSYIVGLLLCLFFSGWQVTDSQRQEYHQELQKIDRQIIDDSEVALHDSYERYYSSKGWFTCDSRCQQYRNDYNLLQKQLHALKADEIRQISVAKSKLGAQLDLSFTVSRCGTEISIESTLLLLLLLTN